MDKNILNKLRDISPAIKKVWTDEAREASAAARHSHSVEQMSDVKAGHVVSFDNLLPGEAEETGAGGKHRITKVTKDMIYLQHLKTGEKTGYGHGDFLDMGPKVHNDEKFNNLTDSQRRRYAQGKKQGLTHAGAMEFWANPDNINHQLVRGGKVVAESKSYKGGK